MVFSVNEIFLTAIARLEIEWRVEVEAEAWGRMAVPIFPLPVVQAIQSPLSWLAIASVHVDG